MPGDAAPFYMHYDHGNPTGIGVDIFSGHDLVKNMPKSQDFVFTFKTDVQHIKLHFVTGDSSTPSKKPDGTPIPDTEITGTTDEEVTEDMVKLRFQLVGCLMEIQRYQINLVLLHPSLLLISRLSMVRNR
ncbi:hypothetical protein [Lactobacillus helveticus]|uniref:hypothetical protein n=1 Tax=Lactobacillus helveticus TaxID=1587 RepID=UPI0021825488|nr:hypothetical protein [Lactobacillus helveticus]